MTFGFTKTTPKITPGVNINKPSVKGINMKVEAQVSSQNLIIRHIVYSVYNNVPVHNLSHKFVACKAYVAYAVLHATFFVL